MNQITIRMGEDENALKDTDAAWAKLDAFNRLSSYRCDVVMAESDYYGEDRLEEVNRLQRFIEDELAQMRNTGPKHEMHFHVMEELLLLLDRLRAVEQQY